MAGFVRGVLWGGVVAAAGLVAVSQFAPPRVSGEPQATTRGDDPVAPERVAPVVEAAPAADTAAPPAAPSDLPGTVIEQSAPEPLPGPAQPDLPVPEVVAEAPQHGEGQRIASAPAVPGQATDAPPKAPVPAGPTMPEATDGAVRAPETPQQAPEHPPTDAPGEGLAGVEPPETAAPGVAGLGAPPSGVAPPSSPAAPQLPQIEAAPAPAELPPPPQTQDALLQPAPGRLPGTPVEPAEPPISQLAPSPSLSDRAAGVVTGRLPRIAPAPAEGEAQAAEDPAPEAEAPLVQSDLPPLQRHARPFENPDRKPLFAVLLEDRGGAFDRAALAGLDLPLTIVIDPLSDGAAERAALWRAGGQEVVLAVSGLAQSMTPADLEQTFQALAGRLPEAVAMIDPTGSEFQGDRLRSAQIVPILKEQGRGLVTFDQGLNAADQVARREGLPSTLIFRRLDSDAGGPAIKRYLDRAVFKAAQEGQVVVIAELTPETVSGLMEWAVEGRAATVALAPITALLGP